MFVGLFFRSQPDSPGYGAEDVLLCEPQRGAAQGVAHVQLEDEELGHREENPPRLVPVVHAVRSHVLYHLLVRLSALRAIYI